MLLYAKRFNFIYRRSLIRSHRYLALDVYISLDVLYFDLATM